jgi:hypothetical protein
MGSSQLNKKTVTRMDTATSRARFIPIKTGVGMQQLPVVVFFPDDSFQATDGF